MRKTFKIALIVGSAALLFWAGMWWQRQLYLDICLDMDGGANPGGHPICVIEKDGTLGPQYMSNVVDHNNNGPIYTSADFNTRLMVRSEGMTPDSVGTMVLEDLNTGLQYAMVHTQSGSGAKYIDQSGNYFWNKGDGFIFGNGDHITAEGYLQADDTFAPQSMDEETEAKIKSFLLSKYLVKDLPAMSESDRRFQFYKVDLNSDGKEEVFVRMMSPYFCGTGGCTYLLLNSDCSQKINTFTVAGPLIHVVNTKSNGWNDLVVESGDQRRLLKADKLGKYPSNPSMVESVDHVDQDKVLFTLFDDLLNPCKTILF